jgi:ParB-like chromosome segregation protein Spo0J
LPIDQLRPWPRNARTHSRKQIKQIAESIRLFGFTNPVLIDGENSILAGHGRVEAARQLGMTAVPCLRVNHLSPAEKRAYVLADNKLALNAGWDEELLALELQELMDADIEFDVGIMGFSIAEVDQLVEGLAHEEAGIRRTIVFLIRAKLRRAAALAISGGSVHIGSCAATRLIQLWSPP